MNVRQQMEGELFEVQFNETMGLLSIAVRGFWTDSAAQSFAARLGEIVPRARSQTSKLSILIDASTLDVQSAASVLDLSQTDASLARESDRTAVVTTSALVKMQFERVMNVARAHYFTKAEDAEAWLMTSS